VVVAGLLNKLRENAEDVLNSKKTVHLTFPFTVHTQFKSKLAENNLSMQEFMHEIVLRCAENDKEMQNIIETLASRKINKLGKRRAISEKNNFYDLLEEEEF
jgi:hypothetical protein